MTKSKLFTLLNISLLNAQKFELKVLLNNDEIVTLFIPRHCYDEILFSEWLIKNNINFEEIPTCGMNVYLKKFKMGRFLSESDFFKEADKEEKKYQRWIEEFYMYKDF